MRTLKTSNPAISVFNKAQFGQSAIPMTLQGTVNKSFILLLLTVLTATLTWRLAASGNYLAGPLAMVGVIGGLVVAMIAIFATNTVNITGPLYALLEGLMLGSVSYLFNSFMSGIVLQAVIITFLVFALMLVLYKFRILKATATFTKVVFLATASIAVFYLVSFVASFFGADWSVFSLQAHGFSWLAIGIQVVIIIVASLNFILDFSYIENGAAQGLPKKMEWYGAFSLLVTLIWLYLEILRLLALVSRR